MNTGREGDLSVDIGVLEDRHADALIFPAVLPDDRAGGAAAVGLAAAAGHRRIALRAGQEGAQARASQRAMRSSNYAGQSTPKGQCVIADEFWLDVDGS
jgi:DNA-binding LacI/PurR family transcriptional regulator